MAAVTICSDFGAKKKVCHCFHCFPIYLPWSDGAGCKDLSFLNVEVCVLFCFSEANVLFILFLLYNIVLVLSYINMNPPWVYTCSPSWTPLPPPFPYHPSGSSQCTSPKHPVSCVHFLMVGKLPFFLPLMVSYTSSLHTGFRMDFLKHSLCGLFSKW